MIATLTVVVETDGSSGGAGEGGMPVLVVRGFGGMAGGVPTPADVRSNVYASYWLIRLVNANYKT